MEGGSLVQRARDERIPKGAVRLSKMEVLDHQTQLMSNWKNKQESFPINYGAPACGLVAAAGACFLTHFFRRKFKLGTYGQVLSYGSTTLLPAVFASVSHHEMVTNEILLARMTCMSCLEVKAAFLQVAFGFAYPLALAPIVSLYFATVYTTYAIPNVTNAYAEVFRMLTKFGRSAKGKFGVVAAVQMALAVGITYSESESCRRIMSRAMDEGSDDELLES